MNAAQARVGAVSEQVRGVSYGKGDASDTAQDGYLPVLRAGNITDTGVVFDNLVYVPNGKVSKRQLLRAGDVLIAASSGSLDVVGKAAPIQSDYEGAFGAFCKVLRPDTERVVPSYFAHFFKTTEYRRTVSSLAAGANINNLRNEHLDDLVIPLPPLPEQRRIAAILDAADTLRAKRREALSQVDRLVQSIYVEMFGEATQNPMSWPRVPLETLVASGPQNGLYKPSSEYGSGTPILRIDGFYSGAVTDMTELKRVRLGKTEADAYALHEDDIVINRVNSPEYLGKSALIPRLQEPVVFESNMMRMSLKTDLIAPRYAIEFLQSRFIKNQIRSAAKDAVNQSSINQKDVNAFLINLPPLALQIEFAKRVEAVEKHRFAHMRSHVELDGLFASLQHRAFRGDL